MGSAAHTVGPNAIIQTLAAVASRAGLQARSDLAAQAKLESPVGGWQSMVQVDLVNRLNASVVAEFGAERAAAIMRDAGSRTGHYILENRIPSAVQTLLRWLPPKLATRVLLKAIAKNAWTFAGSARVEVGPDWICIHDNPICLGRAGLSGCLWHEAVFQTLFSAIVGRSVEVRETHCLGRGDAFCRFEIV